MKEHREHILQSIAIATIILLVSFVVSVLPAHAQIFPSDAKTHQDSNETNTDSFNQLFLSNTDNHVRTILAFAVSTKDSREIHITCGLNGTKIHDTMGNINATQRFLMFKCDQPIYWDKMRTSFLGMTYVDRDVGITPDPLSDLTATIVSTSTSPLFVQDAGNLSFLLTILISLMFLMVVGFVYNNMTDKKPWH